MKAKKNKKDKLVRFSISMPKSLQFMLDKIAKADKNTRSKAIQILIKSNGKK